MTVDLLTRTETHGLEYDGHDLPMQESTGTLFFQLQALALIL